MIRRLPGAARQGLRLFLPLLFISCLSLVAAPAFADTVHGRVLDPQHRPVGGADILVVVGQAIVARVQTDADGRFGPLALPAARYEVMVAIAGFRAPSKVIDVAPASVADLTFELEVAAIGESVVVSATSIDVPHSRAAGAVTVVDRASIDQHQVASVVDAVRTAPGFAVAQSGGPGAVTSLFPRGGESDYTLVLVDGVQQNVFGGGFDAAHLSTADVERIEIVRGPQSALFGGGAIGGIVQVVTRHGGPFRANASAESGGYGTQRTDASATGRRANWMLGGAIERLSTDGDTRSFPSARGAVTNDDYERLSTSANIGWSDRPGRRVQVDLRASRDERGVPGPYGSDPLQLYSGVDQISRGINESQSVGVSATLGQPTGISHQMQATWLNHLGRFRSPYGLSRDRAQRTTARYQADFTLGHVGLSGGGEWLGERDDNTFITGTNFEPVPVRRTNSGLFVEARPSAWGRLFSTVGVRFERIERRALEASPGTHAAFADQVVWSANPKVSITWVVRAGSDASAHVGSTRLRFSAGTGIKAPTGFDIAFTDNPNLKPERSRSVDIGVEQGLFRDRAQLDATWFRNRFDDLIVTTSCAFGVCHSDNLANARATGLELGSTVRFGKGLSGRATWTLLDTEVLGLDSDPSLAPAPFAVGQSLFRRPRHQGSFEINWSHRRATAFAAVNGRGSVLDLEPNFASSTVRAPGFRTAAFGGSIRITSQVEVFARVTNAFDRAYEEIYGYPARGRAAFVGVRVAHGR